MEDVPTQLTRHGAENFFEAAVLQEYGLKNLELEPAKFCFLVHHLTKRQKEHKTLKSRGMCSILFSNFLETVRVKGQLHSLTADFKLTNVLCLCIVNVGRENFPSSFFPGDFIGVNTRSWWLCRHFFFLHLNVFFCAVCRKL